MAILTGERVFSKVQEGAEVTPGTAVTCTAGLNMEATSLPDLDRAEGAPQEDYGVISDRQSNRAYYGVRLMKFPMKGVVRYEDLMRYLEPALAGGITPTTPAGVVKLWTYIADDTTDTLKPRTLKLGDQINAYVSTYCLVEKIHIFYDALAAGSNAPWRIEVDYIGQDLQNGTFDAATNVAGAESPMGHLTRIYLGSTATAFASLSEIAGSLVKFDMTIETGVTTRKEGGIHDTFDSHGRLNRKINFTGTVMASSAGKTNYRDPWVVADSPVVMEKRMRIQALGTIVSSALPRTITIDQRVQISGVKMGEHNGAAIFEVEGHAVDDATLASNISVAVQNGVLTL